MLHYCLYSTHTHTHTHTHTLCSHSFTCPLLPAHVPLRLSLISLLLPFSFIYSFLVSTPRAPNSPSPSLLSYLSLLFSLIHFVSLCTKVHLSSRVWSWFLKQARYSWKTGGGRGWGWVTVKPPPPHHHETHAEMKPCRQTTTAASLPRQVCFYGAR